MDSFVFGFLGALVCLSLLAAGFAAGRAWALRQPRRAAMEADERRKRAEEAEREAFRQLQSYSAEMAYGARTWPGGGEEEDET